MTDLHDELRRWWDTDARTYDRAPTHVMRSPAERAAWTAAIERSLPEPPARVLDAGAGTGFLSLVCARLGHRAAALDLSDGMLGKLRAAAARDGLDVEIAHGPAEEPPPGPFDAIVERHLLWTLPDPLGALKSWRAAAPEGRLALFEGLWGAADPLERARQRARDALRRVRGHADDHHAPYDPGMRARLPLGAGTHPGHVIELVEEAGWRNVTIERLRNVEWARRLALPIPERALGVTPLFVVRAR